MASSSQQQRERQPLLGVPGRDDDDEESNLSGISGRSGRSGIFDFDRRSIIDIAKNPKLLTTLEQGLVILAICLLCLAAIFGGLALGSWHRASEADKERDAPPIYRTTTALQTTTQFATTTVTQPAQPGPTQPSEPPSKNDEICLTPTCVQISAAILDSIDTTVDPCDDFYQFANGGWLKSHPIPAAKGLFGAAQWIGARNQDILLAILEKPLGQKAGDDEEDAEIRKADRQNLQDLKTFYTSCVDEDALDRRGSTPLLDVVEEVVNAWNGRADLLLKKKPVKDRSARLTDALLALHSKGIGALFESSVAGDYQEDPKMLRLWLGQSGLGLPNPDYYEDSAVEKVYKEVIRSALTDVYSKLESLEAEKKKKKHKKKPKYPANPKVDYTQVFDFEKKLARISVDSVDLEDPVYVYNAYNKTALHSLAPILKWEEYFAGFAPRTFPHPVIVGAPTFFGNLSRILDDTPNEILEAYFVWQAVSSLGNLLGPRETARKEVTQLSNYLSGIEEGVRAKREDVCLQALLDNYGFMVGRYFVQEAFSGASKDYAETIIKSTVQAFKDRLPELDWLDPESRKAAEEKANYIGIKIGYATSPNVTSPVALRAWYAPNQPKKGQFFESTLGTRIVDERRKWASIGKDRDPGAWEMIPSEVNAYYSPEANEMAFPAGVLQAPYFSKDYPEYLGFGSMASLAGHELTHAFDSAGRQFDKTGKLTDWWSNDTIARYDKLTECIVDQYARYYVIGPDGQKYHVRSRVTIGEDIADGGGLAQTYRAWQDRFKSDKKGERYDNYILPGLKFTREQLFYIQFARGWARNIKPAEAVRRIRVDEHSPTNFRVIGPLSNSEEFSKAFNCPIGSRMNPKQKCRIW